MEAIYVRFLMIFHSPAPLVLTHNIAGFLGTFEAVFINRLRYKLYQREASDCLSLDSREPYGLKILSNSRERATAIHNMTPPD